MNCGKFLSFFSFFLLFFCHSHNHVHWWENSNILDITDSNFDIYIGQEQHVILEFWTPWCRYCQLMKEDFEKVHEYYNGEDSARDDILIAKVNAETYKKYAHKYHQHSYPAVIHIKPGSQDDYDVYEMMYIEDRKFGKFIEWIEEICCEIKEEVEVYESGIEKDRVVWAVNCGSEYPYIANNGVVFEKDKEFQEESIAVTYKPICNGIKLTNDNDLYLSERHFSDSFYYNITIPKDGIYTLIV